MVSNQKVKHLLHRAAFGSSFRQESQNIEATAWINRSIDNRSLQTIELTPVTEEKMEAFKKNPKDAIVKSRDQLIELNSAWIEQLTIPSLVLREKMTLFWHDHFACRIRSAYLAQQQNNVIRQHALGHFGDLLFAVSKDPGMLQFLNNQQNRKDSPNENFAREVLELFTLGRGHYTEADIKNSARAFTGWSFNPVSGKFFFREKFHDTEMKYFKGKSGKFNGEDILHIILEDKQTARFITEKIWRYFVSDQEIDLDILTSLTSKFYESNYNIEKLIREIFSSTWFYASRFTGNRVKSPVELIVGIVTQTGGVFSNPQATLFIQRALNHVLFLPPNVGGWPSGTAWIDSSSLIFRMSLPSILLQDSDTDIEAKHDGDANNSTNQAEAKKLTFEVNWENLCNQFIKDNTVETLEAIEFHLLSRPATRANKKFVHAHAGRSANEPEFMRNAFSGFMSLPEYQIG